LTNDEVLVVEYTIGKVPELNDGVDATLVTTAINSMLLHKSVEMF
jgi:hypothetical protein